MDRARVVLFEDLDYQQHDVLEALEGTGHSVVAIGSTVDESLAIVDAIASGGLEADVVILDGNLTPRVSTGDDARKIRQAIDAHQLGIKVVGFSMMPMQRAYGIKVDVDARKDVRQLPGILDAL